MFHSCALSENVRGWLFYFTILTRFRLDKSSRKRVSGFAKYFSKLSRAKVSSRSQTRFENRILFRPLLFHDEKNEEIGATDPERLK